MSTIGPLAAALPQAIRPRVVHNNNGLRVHLLEAGFEESGRPCVVLLHGFPELAYSWRKIMMPLASAGFHAIAPDQRGYGRTTGWDPDYDGDLASFRIQNLVKDVLGLALALGYRSVHAVVGHDFGSPVAAYCALIRPDVFRSVVLMSAPFAGPPALPFTWLPEHELRVYSTEYERTGFQGGLQWYRCAISPEFNSELALYSGRTIDVPSYFISGSSDWGHYQRPGALEAMQSSACTDMRGCTLVEGAGHWVQQEQPASVADHVLNFLRSSARGN